jgi:regulator of protease activity HflC (stomatin/prohibitin superfamily)
VLYYQVIDPVKASYGIEDAEFAIQQLAMSTMRSEIGQVSREFFFFFLLHNLSTLIYFILLLLLLAM